MAFSNSELSIDDNHADLRKTFEAGETIAHTLAYDKALEPNSTTPSTDPRYTIQQQDIPTVKFGNTGSEYKIIKPSTAAGLVCYILKPVDIKEQHIKIVFRGTKDIASMVRDTEPRAAGTKTFTKSKHNILRKINSVLEKTTGENISVTLYGHSLAGGDAQNCFVAIMNAINKSTALPNEELAHDEKKPSTFHKIRALTLMVYNSAGVTTNIAQKANDLAQQLKKKNIALACYWQLAAGDGVQQTGETSILANVTHDIAKVYLRKITYENVSERSWQNFYNPVEMYAAITHTAAAHTKHSSGPKASPSQDEIYLNTNESHLTIIRDKLTRKTVLLNNFVTQTLQAGVNFIGDALVQATTSNTLSDSTSSLYADPYVVVIPSDCSAPVIIDDSQRADEKELSKQLSNSDSLALTPYKEPQIDEKHILTNINIVADKTRLSDAFLQLRKQVRETIYVLNPVMTPEQKTLTQSSNSNSLALIPYADNPLNKLKPKPNSVINKLTESQTEATNANQSALIPHPITPSDAKESLSTEQPVLLIPHAVTSPSAVDNAQQATSERRMRAIPITTEYSTPKMRHEITMIACMLAAVAIALAVGTYGIGLLLGIAVAGFVGGGILSKSCDWLYKACWNKTKTPEIANQKSLIQIKHQPNKNPALSSKNVFATLGCLPCQNSAIEKPSIMVKKHTRKVMPSYIQTPTNTQTFRM